MAAFKTDVATAQDSPLVANRLPGKTITGDLRYIEAVYTATGTEAATGDNIEVTDVPIDAVVIPELCSVTNEASMGGSALSLTKLGDVTDDDRYSATAITVDSTNAARQAVTPNVAASIITRTPVTETNKRLVFGFTRTTAMTAGKKLVFTIAYRLP